MAAAVNDIGAILTQRAAQATAREQTRSAVLGRFDAADARRQFSLDQADAARADQAARTTRSRTEQGRASSARARTDERQASPKAEPHQQAAKTPAAKDAARPVTRSDTSAGRSEAKRSAVDEPAAKAVAKAAPPEKAEKPTTIADEAVPHEAEESLAGEVAAASVTGMPQPGTPAPPAPTSSTAPSGPAAVVASEGQQLAAKETETAVSALGTNSANAAGAAPSSDTASQATNASQASPESGAAFSAILDIAEPTAAPSTSTATPLAAKAAASADAASGTSPTQAAAAPVPLGAVPMTIALRSLQNASQFEIRLDPLELGRIDVRLDIDKEAGTVSADLVVDRPSTLALLQRDAGTLQQALSQAGLDASAGISLSLRDGSGGQDRGGDASRNPSGASRGAPSQTATDSTDSIPVRALRLSGLDIRI